MESLTVFKAPPDFLPADFGHTMSFACLNEVPLRVVGKLDLQA